MRVPIVAARLAVPHLLGAQAGSVGPPVTRLGSRTAYGPGIVAAAARRVEFELTRPAHVIVLLVDPDGSIQPVFPASGGERYRAGGGAAGRRAQGGSGTGQAGPEVSHAAPPVMRSAQQLAREGEAARPSATGDDAPRVEPVTAYWRGRWWRGGRKSGPRRTRRPRPETRSPPRCVGAGF